jgi:CRISPR-associated protein Csb2
VDPELAIRWAFDLPPDQHEALDRLAASIPYFGRADSLCTARLVPDWQPYAHEIWSPLDVASEVDDRAPATGVLAPLLPLDMAALLARPLDVRRNGLVYPAGAHLIGYQRGSTALTPRRRTTTATTPVTAVRFSILQTALPPCTDSIIYTDLLRRAALHQLGTLRDRKTTSRLAGKDELGDKLTGNQHAHYLPITDGHRLTSLVVWVPGTLDDDELKALGQLRRLSSHRDNQRLTIRLSGVGDVTDVAPELTGPATTWTSHTPFTPTGHRKPSKDQETHLRAEISRELRHRDQPGLANLDIQPGHWQAWRRHRPSARRDQRQGTSWQPSEFLRITLEQPVPGPLTLGHLSHFGLGLFTPEP